MGEMIVAEGPEAAARPVKRVVVVFADEGGGHAYESLEAALADYLEIPENTVCEWMVIMRQTEQAIARSREIRHGETLDG